MTMDNQHAKSMCDVTHSSCDSFVRLNVTVMEKSRIRVAVLSNHDAFHLSFPSVRGGLTAKKFAATAEFQAGRQTRYMTEGHFCVQRT